MSKKGSKTVEKKEYKTEPTTKLYLGNISFHSTEESLEEAFSEYGKVKEVTIIRRGNRSLGYGFLEMETVKGAEKAIEGLHNQEVDEREIVVEFSDPNRSKRRSRGRGRGRGRFRGRGGFRGGFRGRGRFFDPYRIGYGRGYYQDPYFDPYREFGGYGGRGFGGRGRRFGGRGRRFGGRGRGFGGRGRFPRRRPNFDEKNPSETVIFITNIPFEFTDDDLLEAFTDYNPTRAKVIFSKTGRSKGFGFVEFADGESRDKAISLNETEIGGRTAFVKIAFEPIRAFDEEEEEK
ncbi:RNA recognition motif rrm domain containing protein [Anaeramoeba flamelloides]|uniref:RNA recognition motif rrm domain containing protein n=1 Tax=Anaeramoeba flamelloides TaxID=1746091 RepID=A0AAV7YLE1_9EUKA|nr:RNA recognition motif rrm domain containing protein [Anaeramoeba flamelloides]